MKTSLKKFLTFSIILFALLLMPVTPTWASFEFQTVPTRRPTTATPVNPTITTPTPPTPTIVTSTPLLPTDVIPTGVGPTDIIPTLTRNPTIGVTLTTSTPIHSQTPALMTVTLTPQPGSPESTITLSPLAVTSTATNGTGQTAVPVATSKQGTPPANDPTSGSQAVVLSPTPNGPQTGVEINWGIGCVILPIILLSGVFLWWRSRKTEKK